MNHVSVRPFMYSFVTPFILFTYPVIIYFSIAISSFCLFSHYSLSIHLSIHMSFLITGPPICSVPAAGPSGPQWAVPRWWGSGGMSRIRQGFGLLSQMKLSTDWVERGRLRCSPGLAEGWSHSWAAKPGSPRVGCGLVGQSPFAPPCLLPSPD